MSKRSTRREFHKQLGSVPLLGSLDPVLSSTWSKTAFLKPSEAAGSVTPSNQSQEAAGTAAVLTSRSNVVQVGTNSQLLIDDHVVDDVWMIRRSPEMPVKHLENPIFNSPPPFENCATVAQSVTYDEEEKIFKLWYTIVDTNRDALPKGRHYFYRGAYAVSEDGLRWETPRLGIIDYRGSKDNNLFLNDGTGFILKDARDKDPARRYKMLIKRADSKQGRVFASFSPDGIRWTDYPSESSVLKNSRDGGNSTVFDPRIGKYVLFCRPTVLAAPHLNPEEVGFPDRLALKSAASAGKEPTGRDADHVVPAHWRAPAGVGFPSETDFIEHREAEDYIHRYLKVSAYVHTKALRIFQRPFIPCNRRIARSESEDFIHWSEPEVVIRPDELDPPRLYNMNVTMYRGLYLGLLEVFYSWGTRRYPGCPQEPETFEVQLMFSRDGKRWERLANRPVFLPRGYIGSFDGGMISGAHQPIIEYRDELRIYYTGNLSCHNVGGFTQRIGVARLPRERLVARTAGDELGLLLTKPFRLEGDRLTINADARRGLIKVEATNPEGQPLAGLAVKDAEEIRGNDFYLPVAWKAGSKLSDYRGQLVRLRFYMQDSRLYSFRLHA
ncbi:MAG: hypothetical protein FJW26_11795 [Acidimicrobiia bacterium]|nr:hypothetical protein [Acidimicrobiia bacterium]